jgi:hypothetical protein
MRHYVRILVIHINIIDELLEGNCNKVLMIRWWRLTHPIIFGQPLVLPSMPSASENNNDNNSD